MKNSRTTSKIFGQIPTCINYLKNKCLSNNSGGENVVKVSEGGESIFYFGHIPHVKTVNYLIIRVGNVGKNPRGFNYTHEAENYFFNPLYIMKNIHAKVEFRPAESFDLKINDYQLRIGQAYVVMNTDNRTLSGFHIIDKETNPYELAAWMRNKRLFIPVSCLDSTIGIIKN